MSTGGWIGAVVGLVVGAVVGFIIGGGPGGALTGAYYGAVLGFAAGMYIDPMTADIPSSVAPLPAGAEVMTTVVGDPLPDLMGTAKITGHLLCFGKEKTKTVYSESSGGGKGGGGSPDPQVSGYEYYMSWAIGIVAGPIDTLYTIYKNNDVVWEGELNCPTASGSYGQETIVLDGMGSAVFYFGTDDQTANSDVGDIIGDDTLNSPYRNFCWCFFDNCYIGDYNRCPTMKFVLRKSPEVSFSEDTQIQIYDYNPIHAIWYILHDLAGLPEVWLHTDDFIAAASTIASETRGISCLLVSQQSAMSYLENINGHIDGIIRYGSDGKFHPKLIRDDYVVDDLPLIDENVMLDDPSLKRKSWIDTINEVKVQYTEIVIVRVLPWTTEIYFELLNSEVAIPNIMETEGDGQYVVHLPSMVELNTNEFDGDLTWEFEAIWCNRTVNDARLQIIDSEENVYADMLLSSGLSGYTDWNLFRSRASFTPGSGDITYMLRFDNQGNNFRQMNPNSAVIATARIVLTQTNGNKTKIQLPILSTTYNYALQYYNDEVYSYGIGWTVYDNLSGAYGDTWSDNGGTDYYIMSEAGSTIWRYDQSELSQVSKVVFNVDAKGGRDAAPTSVTVYISTSLSIKYFNLMLYWAPVETSDDACNSGAPTQWVSETQVHVDNCTGATFTPIPDSYMFWDGEDYPYSVECDPDFSDVPYDAKIYIGGEIRIYSQSSPESWQHFSKLYDNPAEAGKTLMNEHLIIISQTTIQMKVTSSYNLADETLGVLAVALWNVTTGNVVTGSRLIWEYNEVYGRKSAEIDLNNFSDGCEYKMVAVAPDYTAHNARIYDAQLLLNINPIDKLTVWQRVTHCYDSSWDNWNIPAGWDASSIGSRIKLLISEDTKAYFEQTGIYVYAGGGAYIALENLGNDDSDGSGLNGEDVTDGHLNWVDGDAGVPLRKRSEELNLTNANIYDNRQPDIVSGDDFLYLGTGFIVLKVVS